jgi:hypothetical protein
MGNRPKKAMPAPRVIDLTRNLVERVRVAMIARTKIPRVAMVR